jgi:hypothetical protein
MICRVALLTNLFASALLASGCDLKREPGYTYTATGDNLGVINWREVPLADSKVSFTGRDPTKKREVQTMRDRYMERIIFQNNGVMIYSRLYAGGFVPAYGPAVLIEQTIGADFYKDKGIVFDKSKVRSTPHFSYIVQSSPSHVCFVFNGYFGEARGEARQGSAGSEQVFGNICYLAAGKSPEALESEMLALLARARFDDGQINRTRATVSG